MGPVVRLIGSGIGLATEAIAHRKESKARAKSSAQSPDQSSNDITPVASSSADPNSTNFGVVETTDEKARKLIADGQAVPVGYEGETPPGYLTEPPPDDPPAYAEDEQDWELDEANAEPTSPDEDDSKPDVRKLLQNFLTAHPTPKGQQPTSRIPCPVIIPQRRPRTKARGFVRAYAPVLEDCGIDQATFMDFIKTFHKASQASPVFKVVFVAAGIAGMVPSPATMIASVVVQVAAGTAIAVQSRSRTNTFLDDVNEQFFEPRGLYALLITFKPSRQPWSTGALDISQTLSKNLSYTSDSASRGTQLKHNMQFSSGTAHTDVELPESAPLIYPALDAAAAVEDHDPNAKKSSAFKRSGKFVGDYMDRRAQAKYAAENPNALSVPQEKQFVSRYSDPNHAVNSGSLISLVTGGAIDTKGARRQLQAQRGGDKRGPRGAVGYLKQMKGDKRLLSEGVLYLMIVNMPSDEEMARSTAGMERAQENGA